LSGVGIGENKILRHILKKKSHHDPYIFADFAQKLKESTKKTANKIIFEKKGMGILKRPILF